MSISTIGNWTAFQSAMPTPRSRFNGVLVGNRVYCMGGDVSTTNVPTNSLDIYDFKDGWCTGAPMKLARNYFGCAEYEGKIYVIGGTTSTSYTVTGSVEIYDVKTNTWTDSEINMPTARRGFQCIIYKDEIYCIGGTLNNPDRAITTVEIYNIPTGTWRNGIHLSEARSFGCAVCMQGSFYYLGGTDAVGNYTSDIFQLDVQNNASEWKKIGGMPSAMQNQSSFVFEDKLYMIGGYVSSPQSTFISYQPKNGTFSTYPELPTPRFGFVSALYDNKVYSFGGGINTNSNGFATTLIEVFVPNEEPSPSPDPTPEPEPDPTQKHPYCCCAPELKIKLCNCNQMFFQDLAEFLKDHSYPCHNESK